MLYFNKLALLLNIDDRCFQTISILTLSGNCCILIQVAAKLRDVFHVETGFPCSVYGTTGCYQAEKLLFISADHT